MLRLRERYEADGTRVESGFDVVPDDDCPEDLRSLLGRPVRSSRWRVAFIATGLLVLTWAIVAVAFVAAGRMP
jgi:hypothetical protein